MRFGRSRYASAEAQMPTIFRPQLTSLIDVLTFLLVFLVKSFSVEGNIITPSRDLELPVSTSIKPPKRAGGLEITRQSVLAEGRVLAGVDAALDSDSLLVPGVYEWMVVEHSKYPDSVQTHEVLIQADRDVEYTVLKKVMYSCSRAGFTDFTILAQQKE